MNPASTPDRSFPPSWRADVLPSPPLIAPARQFVYPQQIAGEEDALARGALRVLVQPASGGSFLATFALGFTSPGLPSGIWTCPRPQDLCAVAGGYAYLIDTADPNRAHLLEMRPVTELLPLPDHALLVFAGLDRLAAWGPDGLAWRTGRLSWEGLRLTGTHDTHLCGFGWNLHTDREVAFEVDLRTGAHRGGGFCKDPALPRSGSGTA